MVNGNLGVMPWMLQVMTAFLPVLSCFRLFIPASSPPLPVCLSRHWPLRGYKTQTVTCVPAVLDPPQQQTVSTQTSKHKTATNSTKHKWYILSHSSSPYKLMLAKNRNSKVVKTATNLRHCAWTLLHGDRRQDTLVRADDTHPNTDYRATFQNGRQRHNIVTTAKHVGANKWDKKYVLLVHLLVLFFNHLP